ncbi:hypothetical protein CC86DRAFT_22238 [Ophiobolus disseminans]|uniref:Anoctamin alpha-beta plait domain-containing protein n=1 Tax=Ophiobolus disseminans TaxID=1469910 RepID=A0A6A7A0P8_9PLEO|nr:hypothetical protein CC86DRAFT_22238 [Ophiobolus disseminans]
MQWRRAGTTLGDETELANITCNDKYVIVYNCGDLDASIAILEISTLIKTLHLTGLITEVRWGYDQSLLVFVQAPADLLSNTIYKSRLALWYHQVTSRWHNS